MKTRLRLATLFVLALALFAAVNVAKAVEFPSNVEFQDRILFYHGDYADGLSVEGAAATLFDAQGIELYGLEMDVSIIALGLEFVNDRECYIFEIASGGDARLFAVGYDGEITDLTDDNGWRVFWEQAVGRPRIGFIAHEYIGDNIAEIPYIEYDGEMDPEIESINRSLNQGIGWLYEDFMETGDGSRWMEIRSYPFTSDEYLQVVVTYIDYPNYGTDGDMFSINYDKQTGIWISTFDVMESIGLDVDTLRERVTELFVPEVETQYVGEIKVSGFLYKRGMEGWYPAFLLTITVENSDGEPWDTFYEYAPEFGELLQLNSFCLFDPYDMDWMNPPLSYQILPEYNEEEN